MALLEKIDKIYLSNPTLCCSQSDGKPDIGNLRETAFLSLMRVKNGFVVKDDIEHGFLNTIPLWAFGLNY
jgi:hypothetical protein